VSSVAIAVISGVGSGLAGAVVSGLVTLRKVRKDLEAEHDTQLRAKRLEHYPVIWRDFASLAISSPKEDLSRDDLKALSDRLRAWYFD
jgi:hypothetical protein